MKTLLRFAVAGAMVASTAAQAQPALPSSNASDLWLFVADPAGRDSFALDTGISIASLMPKASLAPASGTTTPNAILSTAIDDTALINAAGINATNDPSLSAFIANAKGPLEWGVLGMNYASIALKFPGNVVAIFDEAGGVLGGISSTNFVALDSGPMQTFNADVAYLAPTYTIGGTVYQWSAGSLAGQVWGGAVIGVTAGAGSTNVYGLEPDQTLQPGFQLLPFNVGGGIATLYGITGNGNTGPVQSYVLATLELNSNGTLVAAPPVPLPAAVWLFGSGLLGLLGAGRRRATPD
jgi:hypothetical protein